MSIKAKYSREKTAFIGWAPITRYKLGQTLRWADICSFVALTGRRKLGTTRFGFSATHISANKSKNRNETSNCPRGWGAGQNCGWVVTGVNS